MFEVSRHPLLRPTPPVPPAPRHRPGSPDPHCVVVRRLNDSLYHWFICWSAEPGTETFSESGFRFGNPSEYLQTEECRSAVSTDTVLRVRLRHRCNCCCFWWNPVSRCMSVTNLESPGSGTSERLDATTNILSFPLQCLLRLRSCPLVPGSPRRHDREVLREHLSYSESWRVRDVPANTTLSKSGWSVYQDIPRDSRPSVYF